MKKKVFECVQELKKEVDRRYAMAAYKPNGFGDNMYEYKFAILSEMFELDSELGMPREKLLAYAQISDLYDSCSSWS